MRHLTGALVITLLLLPAPSSSAGSGEPVPNWRHPGSIEGGTVARAISDEKLEAIEEYISAGLNVNEPLPWMARHTPMISIALWMKRMKAVRYLLEQGADVNQVSVRPPKGEFFTPLMYAAVASFDEGIRFLIEKGADPNAVGAAGITPLVLAASEGCEECVAALLDGGASPDAQLEEKFWTGDYHFEGPEGATALWMAAYLGQIEAAKVLVERGADKELEALCAGLPEKVIDEDRCTALQAAEMKGHTDLSIFLKGEGPAAHTRSVEVASKYDWYREVLAGGPEIWEKMSILVKNRDLEVLRQLVDDGFDIDAYFTHSHKSYTLLLMAVEEEAEEVVRFLIQEGADVNREMAFPSSVSTRLPIVFPLLLAAQKKCTRCLTLLLEGGADAGTVSHSGDTALAAAARRGGLEMVKALLEAGVEIDPAIELANYGEPGLPENATPLWLAAGAGEAEVVRCLLEQGADPEVEAICGGGAGDSFRDEECTPRRVAELRDYPEVVKVFEDFDVSE